VQFPRFPEVFQKKIAFFKHRTFKQLISFLGLGTHLFVKVPQLGDSKVTFLVFESSCYLLLYTSLTTRRKRQSR